ncbi:MAG: dihydroorotate dehydrogenase [Spirochaetes bacterium]|nr:dihydroorotate dehydrogenase [Spirochaetota bacterium]
MDLKVQNGVLELKNPVLTASGTFGYGEEFEDFFDVSLLGAITIKGTTLNPNPGNIPPRVYETSSGMLNSIGLANIGIDETIYKYETYFNKLKEKGTKVIININGKQVEDFLKIVEKCNESNLFDYYEINVSCPNVKEGGISFSKKPETVYDLVKEIAKVTKKPLITKLSPNVSDIKEYVQAAEEAGTNIISLINTLRGMAIDIQKRKPIFNNIVAGLSGPAIKPIALFMTYEARQITKLPIISMGGICNYKDAIEFLIAGADAIATGSINFVNPIASIEILDGIKNYLKERKLRLKDLNFFNK